MDAVLRLVEKEQTDRFRALFKRSSDGDPTHLGFVYSPSDRSRRTSLDVVLVVKS